MRTSCCDMVSKVTNAPQDVPVQLVCPDVPEPLQVPADENGRSNRAKKYRVYLVPVWQKPPLVSCPTTSSSPTAWTLAAETGLALSATLNRTLDRVPDGKVKRAIPVRGRDGQGGGNRPGTERDLVATGRGLFVGVRELSGGVHGVAPEGALRGQDGYVLVGGAAGTAEMGEAEAVDPGVRVGVPAARLNGVGDGVGAPLNHAEGRVGAREFTHGARDDRPGAGAVERMDERRRVGHGSGGRWLCPDNRAGQMGTQPPLPYPPAQAPRRVAPIVAARANRPSSGRR